MSWLCGWEGFFKFFQVGKRGEKEEKKRDLGTYIDLKYHIFCGPMLPSMQSKRGPDRFQVENHQPALVPSPDSKIGKRPHLESGPDQWFSRCKSNLIVTYHMRFDTRHVTPPMRRDHDRQGWGPFYWVLKKGKEIEKKEKVWISQHCFHWPSSRLKHH